MALLLLLGIAVGGLIAAAIVSQLRAFLTIRAIPSPPGSWLLGHPGVIDNEQAPRLLLSMAKKLGRIFRLRLAHMHFVVVADPGEMLRLTSRGDHYLDKAPEIYKAFDLVHQNADRHNIVTFGTGPQWKALRKAAAPTFTSAHVRASLPLMLGISNNICRQLEASGPSKAWDMCDICKRFTLDVISGWGFGTQFDSTSALDEPHTVVTLVNRCVHAMHAVLADPLWQLKFGSKEVQDGLKATKEYDAWMQAYAESLVARLDTLPKDSIGRAFLELDDPDLGGKLDIKQLTSNVAFFIAAGYETTANAMTMTLLLLLKHPEWLQRVEAELDAAGLLKTPARRQPRELSLTDINQLPVLNAVIKESLRVLPPASLGTFRKTKVETEICGYRVPAGAIINFPPFVIDNSTWSYGDDAEAFKPDRWLAKNASQWSSDEEVQVHASAAAKPAPGEGSATHIKEPFVFSVGSRDCIGQALARLELQVFLAIMLSRFHIRLAPVMGTPAQALDALVYHLSWTPKDGVWVHTEAR